MPIRIRIRLSMVMTIQIRILSQVLIQLENLNFLFDNSQQFSGKKYTFYIR